MKAWVVLVLAVSVAACGLKGRGQSDPFKTTIVAEGARRLQERLGNGARLVSVEVTPYRIQYTVQDPVKPENVDAYEFTKGLLLGPQPVQLMGDGDVGPNTFAFSDVAFEQLPAFIHAAAKAVDIEDAKGDSILIRREFSGLSALEKQFAQPGSTRPEGELRVTLYLGGARRRGYVYATGGLEIWRARRL